MVGLADKAFARGFNVVRLNQRNCGGTESLSAGLYHSGLTHDPLAVMRELAATDGVTRFGVVGYSLGGNLTLKLAGEAGAIRPSRRSCAASAPSRRPWIWPAASTRSSGASTPSTSGTSCAT